jgi:hypothetical protein
MKKLLAIFALFLFVVSKAAGSEHRGIVKLGSLPFPGATITATRLCCAFQRDHFRAAFRHSAPAITLVRMPGVKTLHASFQQSTPGARLPR